MGGRFECRALYDELVGVQIRDMSDGKVFRYGANRPARDGRRDVGIVGLSLNPRLHPSFRTYPGREVPQPVDRGDQTGEADIKPPVQRRHFDRGAPGP